MTSLSKRRRFAGVHLQKGGGYYRGAMWAAILQECGSLYDPQMDEVETRLLRDECEELLPMGYGRITRPPVVLAEEFVKPDAPSARCR